MHKSFLVNLRKSRIIRRTIRTSKRYLMSICAYSRKVKRSPMALAGELSTLVVVGEEMHSLPVQMARHPSNSWLNKREHTSFTSRNIHYYRQLSSSKLRRRAKLNVMSSSRSGSWRGFFLNARRKPSKKPLPKRPSSMRRKKSRRKSRPRLQGQRDLQRKLSMRSMK